MCLDLWGDGDAWPSPHNWTQAAARTPGAASSFSLHLSLDRSEDLSTDLEGDDSKSLGLPECCSMPSCPLVAGALLNVRSIPAILQTAPERPAAASAGGMRAGEGGGEGQGEGAFSKTLSLAKASDAHASGGRAQQGGPASSAMSVSSSGVHAALVVGEEGAANRRNRRRLHVPAEFATISAAIAACS